MKDKYLMLIINLGGTSSKVAIYKDLECLVTETLRHDSDESFANFKDIWDQYDFRKNVVLDFVKRNDYLMSDFTVIVSRGAPVKPMNSGTYRINEIMVNDAKSRIYGNHPTNVGCALAYDLSEEYGKIALTVDAPCVDELINEARYTGWKDVYRVSAYHTLNQKATGRRLAEDLGKNYENINAIIVHMGGGMSIAAHHKGRVEDVNNGLDGDGPMAPERAGTLPIGEVLKAAYSGTYTYEEIYSTVNGGGGLFNILGTKNAKEVESKISEGDDLAREAYDSMIYQISKSIGAAAVTLRGSVEAIALTGGLAYSKYLTDRIEEWCGFIAPIYLYPGENELDSLAEGVYLALSGQWDIQEYS